MGGPIPPGPLPQPPVNEVAGTAPTRTDATQRPQLSRSLPSSFNGQCGTVSGQTGDRTQGRGAHRGAMGVAGQALLPWKSLSLAKRSRIPSVRGSWLGRDPTPLPRRRDSRPSLGLAEWRSRTQAGHDFSRSVSLVADRGSSQRRGGGPQAGADRQAGGIRWAPGCTAAGGGGTQTGAEAVVVERPVETMV